MITYAFAVAIEYWGASHPASEYAGELEDETVDSGELVARHRLDVADAVMAANHGSAELLSERVEAFC